MTLTTKVYARCDACKADGESYENGLLVEHEADAREPDDVVDVIRSHPRCACADPDCMYDRPNLLGLVRERRSARRAA